MTRAFIALLLFIPLDVFAADPITGPIAAKVLRVVDGDTLEVEAAIWPGLTAKAFVRIRNIDAPELRGRCANERRLALAARDLLEDLSGPSVTLHTVDLGKYAGRVVADVALPDGHDAGTALMERSLAVPYAERRRSRRWCG